MNDHSDDHPHVAHDTGHDHALGHGHAHGMVDPSIASSGRGLWAIKWSFIGLAATAILQLAVVFLSGSVALLADTIHNFGDAATAIPLAIAFWFARKKPSERFTFGYGRVEDLAGLAIVLTILASAIIAGYESIERLLHPQEISYLGAVIAASIIGFLGNEAVAIFRIRIGQEINSAALDRGRISRARRRLDEPSGALWCRRGVARLPACRSDHWPAHYRCDLRHRHSERKVDLLSNARRRRAEGHRRTSPCRRACAAGKEVTEVRARWLGHRLHAELNVAVDPELTIAQAHAIAAEVRHQLLHHLDYLSLVVIHVDPANQSGETHHRIGRTCPRRAGGALA